MLWPKFPAFFCKVIFCISAFCWCTFLSKFLLDNRYAFYYPSIIYKLDTYLFICCWCGGTFRHIFNCPVPGYENYLSVCTFMHFFRFILNGSNVTCVQFLCRLLSWLMIHPLLLVLVTTCPTCDQLAPAVVTIIPL